MQIKQHKSSGLWFPEDCDLDAAFKYLVKHVSDIDVSLEFIRKRVVAVQAGGNVGVWPRKLSRHFDFVHTFEAVPACYGAMMQNIRGIPNIMAHNELLSAIEGERVPFEIRKGAVSRVPAPGEPFNTHMTCTTIDALKLPQCDAIFLDVEGHELAVLDGAKNTIEQFSPVITLEIWESSKDSHYKFMDRLGYSPIRHVHGDVVFLRT